MFTIRQLGGITTRFTRPKRAGGLNIMQHFFNNVMMKLGYYNWLLSIRPGSDSYCWINLKQIALGTNYSGDLRQILLHEIAHIGTARFCNQKHNKQFWRHLEDLMWHWIKQPLDANQLRHKKATGGGIYSIRYKA